MSGDLVAGRHGRPRQPLEETPQEYAAFKIEQRGIDLIPDAERKMRPSGLFFSKDFAGFLLYIVVWLAPWFGILITDYVLRGRRYDSLSLRSARDGLYWRNGGIHWPAIIAQVVGMVAALMWINAATAFPSYIGPISSHFPGLAGGDFSWAIGIVLASLLYWALAARGVRREAAQASRL